uniref:Acetylcholinesterase n=1 Tax=Timema cristinae TaxID=61476 RepID=A0A7R9D2M7_TIMCR|nr:unnamed protein product [Timema cristinae]
MLCLHPVSDNNEWPQYSKDSPQYFIFNTDTNGLGHGPRSRECAFWNEFFPKLSESPGADVDCSGGILGMKIASSTNTLLVKFLLFVISSFVQIAL